MTNSSSEEVFVNLNNEGNEENEGKYVEGGAKEASSSSAASVADRSDGGDEDTAAKHKSDEQNKSGSQNKSGVKSVITAKSQSGNSDENTGEHLDSIALGGLAAQLKQRTQEQELIRLRETVDAQQRFCSFL